MGADILKALNISLVGNALSQPEIDRVVAQLVEYKNPLRANVPRKEGSGDKWYLNRRTAGTTGAWWVADTDSITEETGTYEQVNFTYRTLATKGRVTRKLQAIGMTYADVLAEEIEAKALEFRDKEDWGLLYGNADNTNEFDGIDEQIKDQSGQTVNMVATAETTPSQITLAKIDEAIDACAYDPDMIITSKRTRRQINAALQASQRYANVIEVRGGFKVMSYNGIPIFTSTNVYDTAVLNGSGGYSAFTGGTSSSMYILDSDHVWVGVLTEIAVKELAQTTTQWNDFEIYEDITLVVRNPLAHSRLIGIGP